jgi:hypothetical protein
LATDLAQVKFKLSSRDISGEINLGPEAWRILTNADGSRTVEEIARAIGVDTTAAIRTAESLLRAGVLEVASAGTVVKLTVDAAFFDRVTRELARAMGPLASLIVEDEVSAMDESRESFPRERIAELVERISESIRDANKRVQFQQVMLDAIRQI